MSTTEVFLIAIAIIFTVPYLVWRLARTDHYAPLVVVQIIGGILLGPGVLGAVFPDYYAFVFNHEVISALNGIAWWAVMMFVFAAGIELDVGEAWLHKRETAITATLALFAPLLLGSIVAAFLLQSPGWLGPQGTYYQAMVGVGMACAVTALPILVLLMEKLKILRQPIGQRLLRYASLDDIAIWGVLALVLFDWERVGRQLLFLLAFTAAAVLVRRIFARLPESDRWYLGLVWLALCSFAADWSGLHYLVGAFLAGVVLDAKWFDRDRLDGFRNVLLLAVMPVYFLSTGLRTDWGAGGSSVFTAAFLLLIASLVGKLAGVHAAGRILGWKKGEASIIGWLLQTKALIMIVFVSVLLDKGIITNQMFTALLLMAVASTMLTIPMVQPKLNRLHKPIGRTE